MWPGSRERNRPRLLRSPYSCKFRAGSRLHCIQIARSRYRELLFQIRRRGGLSVFGKVIPHLRLGDPPDIVVRYEYASCQYPKTEAVMLNSKASFAFSLLVPAPMRISILAATLIAMTAGMIPLATPADAAEWCSRRKGNTNCAFQTREQCQAAMSGRGGTCVQRRRR
jgi:uncharacterized protein DUF3551